MNLYCKFFDHILIIGQVNFIITHNYLFQEYFNTWSDQILVRFQFCISMNRHNRVNFTNQLSPFIFYIPCQNFSCFLSLLMLSTLAGWISCLFQIFMCKHQLILPWTVNHVSFSMLSKYELLSYWISVKHLFNICYSSKEAPHKFSRDSDWGIQSMSYSVYHKLKKKKKRGCSDCNNMITNI